MALLGEPQPEMRPEERWEAKPNIANHMAWMRTIMGLQRTQLAAVRTSVSLIGFGFTVAQFFQKLQGKLPDEFRGMNPAMPRNVGLVLIAAGVISLAVFTWNYRSVIRYLRSEPFTIIAAPIHTPLLKPSFLVSYVVFGIGLLAFASVFIGF